MKNMNLKDYIYAAFFAALISIMGFVIIPLPFSVVPITLQTLAVMLTGSLLKPRQAAMSMITYLLLGIAGLPVFSGGMSGIGVIIGPRGGYLVGFLIGSITISLLKGKGNNPYRLAISNAIGGIIVVYFIGFIWLAIATKMGFTAAFINGVLPFILGDIVKVIAATFISYSLNKRIHYLKF